MIGQPEIRNVLPHRFPMLLVDRVKEIAPGERVVATKAVTCNEPWYQKLGPDAVAADFAYPKALLTESWAQAAALLCTWESPEPDLFDGKVMLFGGASEITFHRAVLPGDVLEHHAVISRALGDTVIIEGDSRVDGEPVLTVERAVMAFRPASELRPSEQAPVGS
ncbi:3-hydroxyacyl-ACP dehydratase FabZ family protein [Streptomyces sp. NBRC 109706]|uniref:3-hydroxyacyl-ACP dehydratase FabZ family protein n=1 Tax=Streptomyces sp. NBRC 109706 TaxID=1550035 RepID=UPI000785589A|nr:beta-hydroxyacyl-ACP dehydratase [Streptomyces sp. NBRC 109706]